MPRSPASTAATGLGPVISKQLVEMMGGEIGVRSTPGRGSEFYFTLAFGVAGRAGATPIAGPDWSRLRVLAVDDSANAREIHAGLLASLGCRHVEVEGADAALRALVEAADAGQPYDLVLIDWRMPETDGFELARRIRAEARLASTPRLVLVTAYGDESVAQRALAERFDSYLAKLRRMLPRCWRHWRRPSARRPRQLTATAARPAPGNGTPAQLKGCRLLLVDDNELNRIVAVDLLAGVAGAHVVEAHTGREALRHLGIAQDGTTPSAGAFDLVLMDVQMPDMDGLEATRRIRAQPAFAALPVLGMTAHALARDRAQCMDAGMNEVVVKPFEPNALFAVIARWLPAAPRSSPSHTAGQLSGAGPSAVSFDLGLSRCLHRHDLYLRVVQRFLETRRHDVAQLRTAHAGGDRETLSHLAHTTMSTAWPDRRDRAGQACRTAAGGRARRHARRPAAAGRRLRPGARARGRRAHGVRRDALTPRGPSGAVRRA